MNNPIQKIKVLQNQNGVPTILVSGAPVMQNIFALEGKKGYPSRNTRPPFTLVLYEPDLRVKAPKHCF